MQSDRKANALDILTSCRTVRTRHTDKPFSVNWVWKFRRSPLNSSLTGCFLPLPVSRPDPQTGAYIDSSNFQNLTKNYYNQIFSLNNCDYSPEIADLISCHRQHCSETEFLWTMFGSTAHCNAFSKFLRKNNDAIKLLIAHRDKVKDVESKPVHFIPPSSRKTLRNQSSSFRPWLLITVVPRPLPLFCSYNN